MIILPRSLVDILGGGYLVRGENFIKIDGHQYFVGTPLKMGLFMALRKCLSNHPCYVGCFSFIIAAMTAIGSYGGYSTTAFLWTRVLSAKG